jgi:hypothetical protein
MDADMRALQRLGREVIDYLARQGLECECRRRKQKCKQEDTIFSHA